MKLGAGVGLPADHVHVLSAGLPLARGTARVLLQAHLAQAGALLSSGAVKNMCTVKEYLIMWGYHLSVPNIFIPVEQRNVGVPGSPVAAGTWICLTFVVLLKVYCSPEVTAVAMTELFWKIWNKTMFLELQKGIEDFYSQKIVVEGNFIPPFSAQTGLL